MTWQRTEFGNRDDARSYAKRRGILTPDGKLSQAGQVLGDGFTVQESSDGKRWWDGAQRTCQGSGPLRVESLGSNLFRVAGGCGCYRIYGAGGIWPIAADGTFTGPSFNAVIEDCHGTKILFNFDPLSQSATFYLIQSYTAPSGSNDYFNVSTQGGGLVTIPTGATYYNARVYLAAETQPYTGSVIVAGTVSVNGTASNGIYDRYYLEHKNSGGAIINRYNLNTGALTLNNGVIVTAWSFAVTPGDTVSFSTGTQDGASGYSLANNSRNGVNFRTFNGKWEAGAVIIGYVT
jgi:hypothetical protein